jgi:hypothetical protein
VATADGSLPGSGMRTPFTRPPRNRSWRPSSQSVGPSPNKAACAHEPGGGDKGVRGDRILHARRKKTPSRCRRCGRRSGKRAVKRDSPQSRLRIGRPRADRCLLRASSGVRRRGWKRRHSGRARSREVSGRGRRLGEVRKVFAWPHRRAGKRREHECSSGKRFRSAEVDWTHRRSRRPGALTGRTSDTRGLARTNHRPAHDARSTGTASEHGARAFEASSNHGDVDWLKPHAQASSGSHPEGCGLGDSGSPRAASARFPIRKKGVRVVDAPP